MKVVDSFNVLRVCDINAFFTFLGLWMAAEASTGEWFSLLSVILLRKKSSLKKR